MNDKILNKASEVKSQINWLRDFRREGHSFYENIMKDSAIKYYSRNQLPEDLIESIKQERAKFVSAVRSLLDSRIVDLLREYDEL